MTVNSLKSHKILRCPNKASFKNIQTSERSSKRSIYLFDCDRSTSKDYLKLQNFNKNSGKNYFNYIQTDISVPYPQADIIDNQALK